VPESLSPCKAIANVVKVAVLGRRARLWGIRTFLQLTGAGAMEGFLAKHLNYLHRIWQLRYFWFSLVRIDLNSRYKRSFFGIGWSLLRPLAMTTILCIVFGKLFNRPPEEYAPYLLIGMTMWQFLTESLQLGCASFAAGGTFIRQQQIPLAIFPLRTVLGSGFHALVALGVALTITLVLRGCPNPLALLYLIPAIVMLFFLSWFSAIFVAVAQAYFPDTRYLLEISLQGLYFLTPILYRLEDFGTRGRMAMLIEYNPLTSILALVRTPILDGTPPTVYQISISMMFLLAVGAASVYMMRKTERNLIFWI